MSISEAIDLFHDEMMNEIGDYAGDDELYAVLKDKVESVTRLVKDTVAAYQQEP